MYFKKLINMHPRLAAGPHSGDRLIRPGPRDAGVNAMRRHLGVFPLMHEVDLGRTEVGVTGEFPHPFMVAPLRMASLIAVSRSEWLLGKR